MRRIPEANILRMSLTSFSSERLPNDLPTIPYPAGTESD